MGGINKHPSCTVSWDATTRASLHLSQGYANLLQANTFLERALLNERSGMIDSTSLTAMVDYAKNSKSELMHARTNMHDAIAIGLANPSPHVGEFAKLDHRALGDAWNTTLTPKHGDGVAALIVLMQEKDHLEPLRCCISTAKRLELASAAVIDGFANLRELGLKGGLRESFATNEVPFQSMFVPLLLGWGDLMRDWAIDALLDNHAAFGGQDISQPLAAAS